MFVCLLFLFHFIIGIDTLHLTLTTKMQIAYETKKEENGTEKRTLWVIKRAVNQQYIVMSWMISGRCVCVRFFLHFQKWN